MSTNDSTFEVRPIPGFPGYHISNDGRAWTTKVLVYGGGSPGCRCKHDGPMKEMKLQETKQKPHYKVIVLVDENKKCRTRLVGRLVLEAFVGPCPEGMECRHMDGNAHNNNLWNLAWGTPVQNCEDRSRHGRQPHMRGELNGFHKLIEEEVIEIRRRYRVGGITQRELAEEYNVAYSNIRFIIERITWKHI